MHSAAARHGGWPLLFVGITIATYAAAVGVVSQLSHLGSRGSVVAAALTLDLVAGVPLAFYLLVVRRRGLPILTLVPMLVLSVLAASLVLPDNRQQTLRVFETLAIPMELVLISWISWRAASAVWKARRDATADPPEQLRRAAFELTRNHRVAAVFASEIAVFWYAFGSWRARAHACAGSSAFTHHRRSGHAGIVLAFLLVLASEGLVVHALLRNLSSLIAWIFTISSAYAALWVIADYRATVLRPILVSDESLLVRAGLRCTLQVPRARIASIGRTKPDHGKECVNLTFLGTPTHWLTFSEPMAADGPYGWRRRVRAVGLAPDQPKLFEHALADPAA